MLEEAEKLAAIADNVVIKLPLTPDGLGACSQLSAKGIRTNVTLCFSATQAILAASAGATYVSPFAGRLDDIANDGIALIAEIADIFRVQGYETEVLAASLRSPQHVAQAATVGADVATLPAKVFHQMVAHPLTDAGLDRFLADWRDYQDGARPGLTGAEPATTTTPTSGVSRRRARTEEPWTASCWSARPSPSCGRSRPRSSSAATSG